jgi:hypothetical protein
VGVPTRWSGGLPSAPEGCGVPGETDCVARLGQIAAWITPAGAQCATLQQRRKYAKPNVGDDALIVPAVCFAAAFSFPQHGTMRASSPTKCGGTQRHTAPTATFPKTKIHPRHPPPNTPRPPYHHRNSRRWRCESLPKPSVSAINRNCGAVMTNLTAVTKTRGRETSAATMYE